MSNKKTIEISIVILCYKADNLIIKFLDKIIKKGKQRCLNFEMILVANYWSHHDDLTPVMIKKYAS